MGLCVYQCMFLHIMGVCDGGHMAVSWALKDSTALRFRGGEGGQRVNSRFCPAATSVSQTESAVLFRLPPFSYAPSHLFVLTSLPFYLFLPLTPVLAIMNHVGSGRFMLVDVRC